MHRECHTAAFRCIHEQYWCRRPHQVWDAHKCDQQFGENECIVIRRSQRLRKKGNAGIHIVSTMRPGLAKIIEKVRISSYLECPETALQIAKNSCRVIDVYTWLSKQDRWLSESECPHCSAFNYGYEYTLELNTGVDWIRIDIKEFTRMWLQYLYYTD